MPNSETILWTAIPSLILLMLSIIGYLIKTGFDGLKEQLKTIWEKIDRHQTQAEINSLEIAAIKARCQELHANHQRLGDRR
jgi:heme/copper-type cytochrome/quinol oxidase subunit 2